MKEYLTEEKLGEFLKEYFNEGEWIHDKCFLGRNRPDYRNDFYKMIVEFDGYAHYTSTRRIVQDGLKDELYHKNGYKVIHIPYFVQLSEKTISKLFGLNVKYEQKYPHGFIDPKCVLPADFCHLGTKRFFRDLEAFKEIKDEILVSLVKKIESLKNRSLVIPDTEEFNHFLKNFSSSENS